MAERKKKSPAFQFYPDSWLASTDILLMTPAEEGAYIRLLCHAWMSEDCSIPDQNVVLAQLSRLGNKWPRSAETLRAKFVARDGKLYNPRLLQEREKQGEWSRKSALGGKHSAESRWCKGGDEMVITNVVTNEQPLGQPLGNSSSSSLSLSIKQPKQGELLEGAQLASDEPKSKYGVTDERLEEYVNRLRDRHPEPRTCGPAQIRVLLQRILNRHGKSKHEAKLAEIDKNHEAHCRTPKWTNSGGQYADGLANWLAPTELRYEFCPKIEAVEESVRDADGVKHVKMLAGGGYVGVDRI